jgi:membrane associated rhomboid family serine protease
MIPLRDSTPSSTFPIVNISIIIINAAAFFYELSLGSQLDAFFQNYALIPSKFFYLVDNNPGNVVGMVVPFFSSIFLHGGWMHFIGNMWFLWIFGDNVEDSMGRGRYIVFYLLAGVGASIIHLLFNAESNLPTVGASGAISGIMGAYMVLYPKGRVLTLIPIFVFFKIIDIPAVFFLLIWIGIQVVQGVVSLGLPGHVGGVAWWAHIGGFIIGALLIFLFRKRHRQNYYM